MDKDISKILLGDEGEKELEERLRPLLPCEKAIFEAGMNFLFKYYCKVRAIHGLVSDEIMQGDY